MAKKNSFFLAQIQAEYEKKLAEMEARYLRMLDEARHTSRVYEADMFTVSLGRMGFREKRFRALDETLAQVTKEYAEEAFEDIKDDPDFWKTKADLDREIKQYVGSMFVPYDERYK